VGLGGGGRRDATRRRFPGGLKVRAFDVWGMGGGLEEEEEDEI
jgi:hypothetical protein